MTDPILYVDAQQVGDTVTDLIAELEATVLAGDPGNRYDGAVAALDRLRTAGLATVTTPPAVDPTPPDDGG